MSSGLSVSTLWAYCGQGGYWRQRAGHCETARGSGQAGTGETIVTTSTKAIKAYRDKEPTGTGDLAEVSSTEGG